MNAAVFILACVLAVADSSWMQAPQQFQKAASDALKMELQKQGNDCQSAANNREDIVCIGGVASQTGMAFEAFYSNLMALLDPAGRDALNQAQKTWTTYRTMTCDAMGMSGGTGRQGSVSRCEIQLTRSRMKDLDAIYEGALHR